MMWRSMLMVMWAVALAGTASAQVVRPAVAWTFSDSTLDGKRFTPQAGRWVGTLRGEPQFVGEGLQAVVLDGRNHSIQVTDNIAAVPLPMESLTLEAWVMVRRAQPWGGIISAIRDNGQDERGFLLGFRQDRFTLGLASEATQRLTYLDADKPFDLDQWHHVVGTYDGQTMTLYVDGRVAGTSQEQSGVVRAVKVGWLELGSFRDDDEFFPMRGMLHEAAIYDGVMSESQIRRRYAAKRDRLPSVQLLEAQTPLKVNGPFAQFVSRDRVEIRWHTDEPMGSVLDFGPSTDKFKRYVHAQPKVSHRFVLDLPVEDRQEVYRYRIAQLRAGGGEAQTPVYTFETAFNYTLPPRLDRPSPYPDDGKGTLYGKAAQQVLDTANITQGYCLVLGAEEGRLAYELAMRSDLKIIAVESDEAKVQAARRALDAAGLYGTRVSVLHVPLGDDARLPFGPYFANLIVSESMLVHGVLPCSAAEMYRVLRPFGGMAYLGQAAGASGPSRLTTGRLAQWLHEVDLTQGQSRWIETDGVFWMHRRGVLPGAGDWSHQYAGADNAASGNEEHVDDDLRVLWWGRPGPRPMPDRGARNPAPLFTAGHLYVQGNRILFGMDGYNGTVRWAVQMPEVRRANMIRDCSNMAAASDHLYLAGGPRVFALQAMTGAIDRTFAVPAAEGTDDAEALPLDWGYVGVVGDTLLGSGTVRGGAYLGDGGEWYNDDAPDQIGKVTSENLFAYDRKTGTLKWRYERGVIVNATITVHRDTVYFLETRDPAMKPRLTGRFEGNLPESMHLVALDLATGREKWARQADVSMFRYMAYVVAGQGAVVAAGSDGQRVYHLQAFADETGEPLWQYDTATRKRHHSGWLDHPVVVGQRLFANRHTFDLCTGEVLHINEWDFHGCGVMTASNQTMFQRLSFHGMWDLNTGKRKELLGIRTGCWLGLLPAGGMLLAPESSAGCSCTHAIQTTVSFIPRKLDQRRGR